MGNRENIKPYDFTSDQNREEAAKNGRKGGIASGESRRRKKIFKDILEDIGIKNCNPDEIKKIMQQYIPNIDYDDLTYNYALMISMFHRGIVKGNAKCAEFIRDTVGQKPIEKQQVINVDQDGYRKVLMGDEDIFAGDYGSADESDEEEEDKKE